MSDKRYYWFKMSSDFFDRDDVKWVLSKRDGSDYIIIYLNLCLKSLCNGGLLFSKVGEMIIPYDSDSIFRELGGRYKESTILAAISCLTQAGLIHLCTESNCLAISNIESFIGSETESAKRMRKMRSNKASLCYNDVTKCDVTLPSQGVTSNVTLSVTSDEHQEKRKEKEDKRKEIKENKINLKINYLKENSSECNADVTDSAAFVFPSQQGDVEIYQIYVDEMQKTFPAIDVLAEIRKAKNWCFANPKNTKTNIGRFLYNWFTKAQDKAPRVGNAQTVRVYKNPDSNRYHDVGEEVDL